MATKKTSATPRRKTSADPDNVAASTPRRAGTAATRRKAQAPATPQPAPELTEDDVRVHAYFLSLQRNGHQGDPVADWLRAERELTQGPSEGA